MNSLVTKDAGALAVGNGPVYWQILPSGLSLSHKWISGIAALSCLLATLYWGLIASDRYVSEARIVLERTDIASGQTVDFASLMGGSSAQSRSDQLMLRNHLLSMDMLDAIDAKLNLRAHYSNREHDFFSRMWSPTVPREWFYRHFLGRVSVDFDDYTGVLVVKAQAYDAETSHAIALLLLEEGERSMNDMSRRLSQAQVDFVEKQVAEMAKRYQDARMAVTKFQSEKGLISPQNAANSLAAVINELEAQRAEIQARRTALLGYLAPQAPAVVELNLQLAALERQANQERARLASRNTGAINSMLENFQQLEMAANFAGDIYKTSLVALEKARIEATRTLKKVSVLQSPSIPESALEPRRLYNTIVFIVITLILMGILHLLVAIVRDHKD